MNIPVSTQQSPFGLTRREWVPYGPVRTAVDAGLQISVEDWDALFRAVITRLTEAAQAPPKPNVAADLQPLMLDCVDALQLLHVALTQQRASRSGQ